MAEKPERPVRSDRRPFGSPYLLGRMLTKFLMGKPTRRGLMEYDADVQGSPALGGDWAQLEQVVDGNDLRQVVPAFQYTSQQRLWPEKRKSGRHDATNVSGGKHRLLNTEVVSKRP
ncbi:unnamed protein product [Penicillium bialowiezense]